MRDIFTYFHAKRTQNSLNNMHKIMKVISSTFMPNYRLDRAFEMSIRFTLIYSVKPIFCILSGYRNKAIPVFIFRKFNFS